MNIWMVLSAVLNLLMRPLKSQHHSVSLSVEQFTVTSPSCMKVRQAERPPKMHFERVRFQLFPGLPSDTWCKVSQPATVGGLLSDYPEINVAMIYLCRNVTNSKR